jgi:hypothetical protein
LWLIGNVILRFVWDQLLTNPRLSIFMFRLRMPADSTLNININIESNGFIYMTEQRIELGIGLPQQKIGELQLPYVCKFRCPLVTSVVYLYLQIYVECQHDGTRLNGDQDRYLRQAPSLPICRRSLLRTADILYLGQSC